MYKTSSDRRFIKNKKAIRRAFIDLVLEKGYYKISISDIAERADINRMTFYSHYDNIEDIFNEFIDDMEAEIVDSISQEEQFSLDRLFEIFNELMLKEIDFFRYVAKEGNMASFRHGFKNTIGQLIRVDFKAEAEFSKEEQLILSDLAAVSIAYSYLDWLAGEYGDLPLERVTEITKTMLKNQLKSISYKKEVDVIMFMGQSNMAGRGITCERFPEEAPALISGAGYEYRAITAPNELSELKEPFGVNENKTDGINDGKMKTGSMVTAFVNSYFKNNGGVPVVAVSASKGGSIISQWQENSKEKYLADAMARLAGCKKMLAKKGISVRHIYMVWCQGESDGDVKTPKTRYLKMLRATFDKMKEAGVEHIFTIQIGRCNIKDSYDRYENMIEWQTQFAAENSDVTMIDQTFKTMRERGLMKDAFHYYQAAYNEVGEKAGKKMAEITG